jgi:hypothetical protein
LVLALGITGCSDDDDFVAPDVPINVAVAAVTPGVLSAINSVTALAAAIPQPSENGALGGTCTDVSKQLCTLGGFAEVCDFGLPEVNVDACDIPGVGVLDNITPKTPAIALNLAGGFDMNLLVDNSTSLTGTLTVIPDNQLGGPCFLVSYVLTVTVDGVASSMTGTLSQCVGGFPSGLLNITLGIGQLNLNLLYNFNGTVFGFVDVTELPNTFPSLICDINLAEATVDCFEPKSN